MLKTLYDLFVYVNALCLCQHFFSHVGMFSCLPGLKHYQAEDQMSSSRKQHSASDEFRTSNSLIPSLTLYHKTNALCSYNEWKRSKTWIFLGPPWLNRGFSLAMTICVFRALFLVSSQFINGFGCFPVMIYCIS